MDINKSDVLSVSAEMEEMDCGPSVSQTTVNLDLSSDVDDDIDKITAMEEELGLIQSSLGSLKAEFYRQNLRMQPLERECERLAVAFVECQDMIYLILDISVTLMDKGSVGISPLMKQLILDLLNTKVSMSPSEVGGLNGSRDCDRQCVPLDSFPQSTRSRVAMKNLIGFERPVIGSQPLGHCATSNKEDAPMSSIINQTCVRAAEDDYDKTESACDQEKKVEDSGNVPAANDEGSTMEANLKALRKENETYREICRESEHRLSAILEDLKFQYSLLKPLDLESKRVGDAHCQSQGLVSLLLKVAIILAGKVGVEISPTMRDEMVEMMKKNALPGPSVADGKKDGSVGLLKGGPENTVLDFKPNLDTPPQTVKGSDSLEIGTPTSQPYTTSDGFVMEENGTCEPLDMSGFPVANLNKRIKLMVSTPQKDQEVVDKFSGSTFIDLHLINTPRPSPTKFSNSNIRVEHEDPIDMSVGGDESVDVVVLSQEEEYESDDEYKDYDC